MPIISVAASKHLERLHREVRRINNIHRKNLKRVQYMILFKDFTEKKLIQVRTFYFIKYCIYFSL